VICRRRMSQRMTGRPRPIADGTVEQTGDGQWRLRIGRELKSPNKTLWAHWRIKQRERQDWERALELAAAEWAGVTTIAGLQLLKRSLQLFLGAGQKERRRVVVTRLVPSTRNFIKDDDNLAYAGKHLFDAMKRVGLIFEDKREWLDAPRPTQAVSPDGTYTTVIEITRLGTTALKTGSAIAAGGLYGTAD
jgi:hypothetical protein